MVGGAVVVGRVVDVGDNGVATVPLVVVVTGAMVVAGIVVVGVAGVATGPVDGVVSGVDVGTVVVTELTRIGSSSTPLSTAPPRLD